MQQLLKEMESVIRGSVSESTSFLYEGTLFKSDAKKKVRVNCGKKLRKQLQYPRKQVRNNENFGFRITTKS
jgi:hypothetical protein